MQQCPLILHSDSSKQFVLTCDASPYGKRAVNKHSRGVKPIVFASRTLSKAKHGYTQIDREALGIIIGIKKFHEYIIGYSIEILTNHKKLLRLLSGNRTIPEHALAWLQR